MSRSIRRPAPRRSPERGDRPVAIRARRGLEALAKPGGGVDRRPREERLEDLPAAPPELVVGYEGVLPPNVGLVLVEPPALGAEDREIDVGDHRGIVLRVG